MPEGSWAQAGELGRERSPGLLQRREAGPWRPGGGSESVFLFFFFPKVNLVLTSRLENDEMQQKAPSSLFASHSSAGSAVFSLSGH